MRAPAVAPRLLLGTESLLGVTRAPRDRAIDITSRYADASTLAVTISKALNSGADGILAGPTPTLRKAVAHLKQPVPIYALLPNVPEYVRDSSDVGLVGAAIKRVKRASPPTLMRLGITGLTHAFAVLRSDFAGLVPLLLELEAASLGARELRGVVLAAPLTDLALAGRHKRFFQHYCRFVRGRFRAAAGFETHNLGHLLRALREWGVKPDFVIGPVNPRGLLMKPTAADVLAELRQTEIPVLAKELRAGCSVTLADGAAFARSQGVHGLVPDLVDIEEAGAELRELRG